MKTPAALILTILAIALPVRSQTVHLLTTDGRLASAPVHDFANNTTPITLTGVTAGETLVAIDVRPQNQRLYALGVNATTNTATLYHVSPETGALGVVGLSGSVAYRDAVANPVDFPDPATAQYDIDFNPAVDRVRVVTSTGLNFRINPNTGGPVDGDLGGAVGSVANVNTDGPINGGTNSVNATAYTNNQPNNGGITTQYTVDAVANALYIQNPPNSGTQTSFLSLKLNGTPLDVTEATLDIPPGVNAAVSNIAVANGTAYMVAKSSGTTHLYITNLSSGESVDFGTTALSVRSSALITTLSAAAALDVNGTSLLRFSLETPGTTTSVAITGLTGGERLVGMDTRPSTGQLYALGVNFGANNATLYLMDPQTGALTAIGSAGGITGTTFPDPATTGYGVDFNPTVDRIRVVASNGLNIRVNPITGALAAVDTALNGGTATASAYTNSHGGATVTTLYALDTTSGNLFIQNPPNNGTLATVGNIFGVNFNASAFSGFDIPPSVAVSTSNTAASGFGWALLGNGGGFFTQLFRINLATGAGNAVGGLFAAQQTSGLVAWASVPKIVVEQPAGTALANGGTVSFGAAPGVATATRTVTIKNEGSQPLTYRANVQGSLSFDITSGAILTVAGNSFANIEISYIANSTGTETATLDITSDDPNTPDFSATLSGAGLIALTDDQLSVTSGDTRFTPLANDGLDDAAIIVSTSEPGAIIEGRTLIIPDGFTGTITYTVDTGNGIAQGTVTVAAATVVAAPKNFSGLIYNNGDRVVGYAKATITKGIASVSINGGVNAVKAKVPVDGSVYTNFGILFLSSLPDGKLDLQLGALGGFISGTLRPAQLTSTAAKHHIALASPDAATYPGGGYAIATLGKTATIKIAGLSVDGVPFSGSAFLNDNGSFTFFSAVKTGLKAPAFIGGELFTADLATTDVTGELDYIKFAQPITVKGVHLGGVGTTLTANGCIFPGANAILAGPGTLNVSGGNLAADENANVTVTAGVPVVPTGALKSWAAKTKAGTFAATVAVPTITKPVKGGGLYLPKSNTAWGYFPGNDTGGRIQLSVP